MPSDGLRSLVPFTFHTFTFRLLPPPLLAWQLVPTCHIRKEEGGRLTKPHMHYELHFSAAAQILKSQWERHIYTRTNKKQVQVQVNTDVAKKWKKKNKKQIRKMTLIPNKTADIQMTEKCCWNWSVAVQFSFVNQNRKKIYNVRKKPDFGTREGSKEFLHKTGFMVNISSWDKLFPSDPLWPSWILFRKELCRWRYLICEGKNHLNC